VKPDMNKYARVGREIRAMMLDLTPLVEPLSIDEAFLDLGGTQRLHGEAPAATLARFAKRVETDVGVTVSVGLSYCKFLAKMASELDKPRGFAVIGRAEAKTFLAARPVGAIWGVGKVAEERLARDGFRMIGDIQKLDQVEMFRRLGAEGGRLWRLSNGLDDRPVSPDRDTKSVSAETTFDDDISDVETLAATLYRLSEKVSARLKKQEIAGRTVTVKLKTADFKLRTRARALSEPTQLASRMFGPARELLAKEADGTKFRLIGVGLSDLCAPEDADHGDLVDTRVARDKATEAAMDKLRAKFGADALVKGITLTKGGRR
jgi:DNA polymerase-4